MANYSSKFRVFQNFGAPTAGTALDQNVFVFGPKYALHRYTDEDERAQLTGHLFTFKDAGAETTAKDLVIDNPFVLSAYEDVDLDGVEVYMEDAYVNLLPNNTYYLMGEYGSVSFKGDYLDGVLVFSGTKLAGKDRDEAVAKDVVAGDYIAFRPVSDDDDWQFVRIADVKVDGNDTIVTLSTGAPDCVADMTPELYVCTKFGSVEVEPVTKREDAVVIGSNTAVTVNDETRYVIRGKVFVGYRALSTVSSNGIQVATSSAEVESILGKADPKNPISMGVFNAFVGGAPVVYYYVTAGEKASDFAKALDLSVHNKTIYYLVPMSQDNQVLDTVIGHVKAQSTENTKHWRIAVLCSAISNTNTVNFTVTGFGKYSIDGVYYKTLKVAAGAPDVSANDEIVADGVKYFAVKRLNNTTILTDAKYEDAEVSASATGDLDVSATLTHVLTNVEYVTAAAGSAKAHGTFRCVDLFPKTYSFGGDTYNSMFAAPIIAGMKVNSLPHEPITNAVIPGVDAVPEVYTRFSDGELDIAAAGGNLVMTQDQAGDAVYVRKQITTGVTSNVLAKSELSMLVNFDNVTYQFDSLLEVFKGSYNVTSSLIRRVRAELSNLIYKLSHNMPVDSLLGPQILGGQVKEVYVDPTNATRIIAHVVVVLPAPFNEMDLYLSVDVTTDVEAYGEQE